MTIVVADLGASNARFAMLHKGRLSDVYMFACDDFKSPEALISAFVKGYAKDVTGVILGVPGVVLKGKAYWTNRKWILNINQLKKKLNLLNVLVLNDVEVQGYALSALQSEDVTFLQGKKSAAGPKVFLNVGTGLGVCYQIDGRVFSAEYGQTLLANAQLTEGLVSATAFKLLKQEKKGLAAQKIQALFYERLAFVATNLALTFKATGGIYLYGGMLEEKNFKKFHFVQHFLQHPKMKEFLRTIPIVFVKRKNLAFVGVKELAKQFD